MKTHYISNWKTVFKMAKLGNLTKPLTASILSNPNHKITKHILYMYSMECFIYERMNRACREKDKSEIEFFGPFAAALSYIIHKANDRRKDQDKLFGTQKLYRGLKVNE